MRGQASKTRQESEDATTTTARGLGDINEKGKSRASTTKEQRNNNCKSGRGTEAIKGSPPVDQVELDCMAAQANTDRELNAKWREARRQSLRRKTEEEIHKTREAARQRRIIG